MKNYNFERDLMRKIAKSERDLRICYLFAATQSITKVAEIMKMGRNTVSKVISERYLVENGEAHIKIDFLSEMPKLSADLNADDNQNEAEEEK